VIDLRVRFGLPAVDRPRKSKWIVVDVLGGTAALVVDAVTDVFGTGGADLQPPPEACPFAGQQIAKVRGPEAPALLLCGLGELYGRICEEMTLATPALGR